MMQYWKPDAENEFAGDMMPFWDGDRFHLFYLLDREHHAEQGGLAGHQWAHASTSNLVNWQHHPLAVPIGAPGSVDQHGICTGAIFAQEGLYHGFYATRLKRPDGSVFEAICRAVSQDLIHFDKSPHNPIFAAPPGLNPGNHRDPFVFRHPETGRFHMLVTASADQGDAPADGREHGVLAHYTSPDLDQWQYEGPFLSLDKDPTPECPEHFFWKDWWYLVYSQGTELQYWISRDPLGPWQRTRQDSIEPGPNLTVPRTAALGEGRRIAVGFLPWRKDAQDTEGFVYAGTAVFRELLQQPDGTLATRFVPEMMPLTGAPLSYSVAEETDGELLLEASDETTVAHISDLPLNCTITFQLIPEANTAECGLLLRMDDSLKSGYRLSFTPQEKRVALHRQPERVSRACPRPRRYGWPRSTHRRCPLPERLCDRCLCQWTAYFSHTLF